MTGHRSMDGEVILRLCDAQGRPVLEVPLCVQTDTEDSIGCAVAFLHGQTSINLIRSQEVARVDIVSTPRGKAGRL